MNTQTCGVKLKLKIKIEVKVSKEDNLSVDKVGEQEFTRRPLIFFGLVVFGVFYKTVTVGEDTVGRKKQKKEQIEKEVQWEKDVEER